jgi:hypothetical protein
MRKQAYLWREQIALSLLGKPTDLPCWRWTSDAWPVQWEEFRQKPLRMAFQRLTIEVLRTIRSHWRIEGRVICAAILGCPVHHALICLKYRQLRSKRK